MIDKTYPSEAEATIILCDDARHEVGNKPSFMGVYFDKMVFSKEMPDDQLATPFTIVFYAIEGEGTFNTKVTIVNPKGETRVDTVLGEQVKEKNAPLLIVYKFALLKFSEVGEYKFNIHLDDKVYQKQFTIEKAK